MEEDWQAVAKAIKDRMEATDTRQKDLAEKTGLSTSTLRELTRGDSDRQRSPATLAKVSIALGWPSGHLRAIARHEDPPEADDSAGADGGSVFAELLAIREHLERIDARLDKLSGGT